MNEFEKLIEPLPEELRTEEYLSELKERWEQSIKKFIDTLPENEKVEAEYALRFGKLPPLLMMQNEENYKENLKKAIKRGSPVTNKELEEIQSQLDLID